MIKKLLFVLCILFLVRGNSIKAQDDDTTWTKEKHKWKWNWDWEDDWGRWDKGRPMMEFSYGLGEPKHDKMTSKFAKTGLAELKLGYGSYDSYDDNITEFNEKYAFVSKISSNLQSEKANFDELNSELYRFGFGRRSGYGYDFGSIRILPYTANAAVWSKLDMKDYADMVLPLFRLDVATNDSQILDRFNKEIRFGTLSEGGIRLEAGRFISFNAGYEAAVIFPRHLVWKQFISFAIEAGGLSALDNFIDEILDSSPAAAPIVNFVLKNGFSYAFYTLKKEKMNWPFNTEAPLTYETLKFGVTFTF